MTRGTMGLDYKIENLASRHMMAHGFSAFYCAWGDLAVASQTPSEVALGVTGRSYFDLASLTKALVTTPLCFKAQYEGLLDFQDPVAKFLPQLKFTQPIIIEDLLTHHSGLPFWKNFWILEGLAANPFEALSERSFYAHLGSSSLDAAKPYCYSDLGFMILGKVIEEIYGRRSLSRIFEDFMSELGLSSKELCFMDGLDNLLNVQSTGVCPIRKATLVGQPHDENAAAFGGIAGHAGLFGSGLGVVGYLAALLNTRVGEDLFSANLQRVKEGRPTMGWARGNKESVKAFGGGQAIGHQGFTGVDFWIKEDKKFALLLTNRVASGRLSPWMLEMRKELFGILEE